MSNNNDPGQYWNEYMSKDDALVYIQELLDCTPQQAADILLQCWLDYHETMRMEKKSTTH
jgi:hypothetical protein